MRASRFRSHPFALVAVALAAAFGVGLSPWRTTTTPRGPGGERDGTERAVDRPSPDVVVAGDDRAGEASSRLEAHDAAVAAPTPLLYDEAFARSEEWVRKIAHAEDEALQDEGLREVEQAIEGDDRALVAMAVQTLWAHRERPFDAARLRPALRRHLTAEHSDLRVAAATALAAIGGEPGDLERIIEAVPGVEDSQTAAVLSIASEMNGRRVDGLVAQAYVRAIEWLPRTDAHDVAATLASRWSSPEVQEAVLTLRATASRVPGFWEALLPRLDPPREAVVRAMFDHLRVAPSGGRSAVFDRLRGPLPDDVRAHVALLAVEALVADPRGHRTYLELARVHGSSEDLPGLDALARTRDIQVRGWAQRVAAEIRNTER